MKVQKSLRLPTKQTTKHIPKPRQPEGAVNSKGYQKVISNKTGRVKWFDVKKPFLLDLDGELTHDKF